MFCNSVNEHINQLLQAVSLGPTNWTYTTGFHPISRKKIGTKPIQIVPCESTAEEVLFE